MYSITPLVDMSNLVYMKHYIALACTLMPAPVHIVYNLVRESGVSRGGYCALEGKIKEENVIFQTIYKKM